MNKSFCIASLGLACLISLGCGGSDDKWTKDQPPTVEASGVLTVDGEPLGGVTIVLSAVEHYITTKDGKKFPARSMTRDDGSFSINAFTNKTGVVAGKYKVIVTKTIEDPDGMAAAAKFDPGEDGEHEEEGAAGAAPWKNVMPKKYATSKDTPITIDVPKGGTDELKIEVSTK